MTNIRDKKVTVVWFGDGTLGGCIRYARHARGLTQAALSGLAYEAVGISAFERGSVSHWESGFAAPTMARIGLLATLLCARFEVDEQDEWSVALVAKGTK